MATINSVNNTLTSATGTNSFVGSASPVLTGNNDLSGATTLRIPNSAAPTVNVTGQIALDTTVTGYPGLIKYYDGTQEMAVLGMASADFSATNNYVIAYNSASSKLNMVAQSGGTTGSLLQYVIATSTTLDSTTSLSYVNTSLTASITPISASSNLRITFTGSASASLGSGSSVYRSVDFQLRRTAPTSLDLSEQWFRTEAKSGISSTNPTYCIPNIVFTESAGTTSLHTYIIRFRSNSSPFTGNLLGSTFPAMIIIEELV